PRLVSRWTEADHWLHRLSEAHALPPERALPGHGRDRASGAREPPRREDSRHDAAAAHAQGGKADRGVGGLRILDDVGIKVHKLKHLRLHAKMLLADGVAAIVGSINLAPGSLDERRELAIEVRDEDVVDRLYKVAHHDWNHSHPIDLSDEG